MNFFPYVRSFLAALLVKLPNVLQAVFHFLRMQPSTLPAVLLFLGFAESETNSVPPALKKYREVVEAP